MNNEQYKKIMERLDFIEFRQELIFNNTDIDRTIFEYKISRKQYNEIMNLMVKLQDSIENGEKYSHYDFEQKMYKIVPEHDGDYHMCELIAKEFMNDGRWEDVFKTLYGDMTKYSNLKK